jgi:hypothetical protein
MSAVAYTFPPLAVMAGAFVLLLGDTCRVFGQSTIPPPVVTPPPVNPPPSRASPPSLATGGYSVGSAITIRLGAPLNLSDERFKLDAPLAPVSVLPGCHVTFIVSSDETRELRFRWKKDGVLLSNTASKLEMPRVTAFDSGIYTAEMSVENSDVVSTIAVPLRVESQQGPRFLNFSTRARISPSQPYFITGFVIERSPGPAPDYALVAIRAIGPSLGLLGIADALSKPRLQVLDGNGRDASALPRPPIVAPSWAEITSRTGAFPIPLPLFANKDIGICTWLPPGAYSILLSSEDDTTGTVLLEVYRVPYE